MKIDILRLKGKGIKRLEHVLLFFTLTAAAGWEGRLWVRRPNRGTLRPWQIIYEGEFVERYYKLLTRGDWSEAISMENLKASSLKAGEPWPE